ncbi:beta-hexosaminidase subunit beta-like [Lineus longissimus]|uniref:beta-hexosaminidase subunit beta-like n=1 Tax=Lineus longissimus TaxID=88925 RepID=UPI002B4EB607
MECRWIILLGLYLRLASAVLHTLDPRWPKGTGHRGMPWPLPRKWKESNTLMTIDPDKFYMWSDIKNCDIIDMAFQRYQRYLFEGRRGILSPRYKTMHRLDVVVSSKTCDYWPRENMDEAYNLTVSYIGFARVAARTVWGAIRGIETFTQLIWIDGNGEYMINKTTIEDSPRFAHRGVLIDTARHFIPTPILKLTMDAMSYNKLNVFHWHMTDDESFPYESKTFPELHEMGAYSIYHTYSPGEITELAEYGRELGIRIIPEIDSPDHTQSWAKSHPELFTACQYNDSAADYRPQKELLNPLEKSTYNFVSWLIWEIAKLFPDHYIHVGLNDLDEDCWRSNPNISAYMKRKSWPLSKVQQQYTNKVLQMAMDEGKKPILWQTPLEKNVKLKFSNVTIQIDKELTDDLRETIRNLGYDVIVSACWDLHHVTYGEDWRNFYECEPENYTGGPLTDGSILGGEATIWTQYIDGPNMVPLMWPRASAMAERLWSPKETRDIDYALYRLDEHRCRMLRHDVPSQPLTSGYCGEYEFYGWVHSKAASSDRVAYGILYIMCACIMDLIKDIFTFPSTTNSTVES